ncbi:MAG: tetratricopeptide repeat protein, partial [Gallionellaceae bacterium]|nr:tetratricopeptide repeat protein [Gallionellaceae bacterium]
MKTRKSPAKLFALVALFASSVVSAQGINKNWQESYSQEASGNYAKAAAAVDLVLQASPSNEFAYLRRGWLNYMQARYNDALRDYDQALRLNPKSQEAQLGRTLPLMAQQRWREAAGEATKVIASSRWDYTAHLRL